MTDVSKVINLAEKSIELNKDNIKGDLRAEVLDWTNQADIDRIQEFKYDIIIGSDLLYLEEIFPDLVNCLY